MATLSVSTIGTNGRDYVKLSTWEAAKDGNIVLSDLIEKAEVYNDSVYDDAVHLNSWSTNATHYIWIFVPTTERHTGIVNTGARIVYTGTAGVIASIYSNEPDVRIEGIEIHSGSSGDAVHNAVIITATGAGDFRISKCLFWGENQSDGQGVVINDVDITVKMWNNIIYDCDTTAANSAGIYVQTVGTLYAYNNTIYDCKYGIKRDAGTVVAINNACFSNATADFSGTFDAESDYNCSSDTTAPGTNSKTSRTANTNFVNVTAGSEDLHVQDTDADLYFSGISLIYDIYIPFFDDIGEQVRITWDIGADEYSAGTSSASLVMAKKYYSIWKNGLTLIKAECELVDVMTEIGDIVTIETGNPQILFTKGLVYKVERIFGEKNRVIIYALTGGWQYDEDGAWA